MKNTFDVTVQNMRKVVAGMTHDEMVEFIVKQRIACDELLEIIKTKNRDFTRVLRKIKIKTGKELNELTQNN